MKNVILFLILLASAMTSLYTADADCYEVPKRTSDTVFGGIQGKIESAMNNCFVLNSVSPLDSLSESLNKGGLRNNIVQYWKGYIDYCKSVFYMKVGNRDESAKLIKEASFTLDSVADKTSEDYALLALMQSFSIQFVSGVEAGKLALTVRRNAEKAVEMDSTNARGWYILGSHDYYAPAGLARESKVEYYLRKAISFASKSEDACRPTWGKEYAYELLIRYYIQNGKEEEAKECLSAVEKENPDCYFIRGYKKKLDMQ